MASADGGTWEIAIGVACALSGSVVLAIGMVGQRYAHLRISRKSPGRAYIADPVWLCFFGIFLLGNLGDMIALSFAPQSVVTPLGSASLLSTPIFARLLLKEEIGLPVVAGSLCVISGVSLVVAPSLMVGTVTSETVDSLAVRWGQLRFQAWAICSAASLALATVSMVLLERRGALLAADATAAELEGVGPDAEQPVPASSVVSPRDMRPRSVQPSVGAAHGQPARAARPAEAIPNMETRATAALEVRLLRLHYCFCTAILASWTVLFTKSAGECLRGGTTAGGSALKDYRTYLMVGGVAFTIPVQLFLLNRGLQRFDASFIVPVMQARPQLPTISLPSSYHHATIVPVMQARPQARRHACVATLASPRLRRHGRLSPAGQVLLPRPTRHGRRRPFDLSSPPPTRHGPRRPFGLSSRSPRAPSSLANSRCTAPRTSPYLPPACCSRCSGSCCSR